MTRAALDGYPLGDDQKQYLTETKPGKYRRLRPLCSDYHAAIHEAVVALVFVERELGFDPYTGKAGLSY